jgi:hypothetical protein
MSVGKMYFGQMSSVKNLTQQNIFFGQMSFNETSVIKMSVSQMHVILMSVSQMPVGQMIVDKIHESQMSFNQ